MNDANEPKYTSKTSEHNDRVIDAMSETQAKELLRSISLGILESRPTLKSAEVLEVVEDTLREAGLTIDMSHFDGEDEEDFDDE